MEMVKQKITENEKKENVGSDVNTTSQQNLVEDCWDAMK